MLNILIGFLAGISIGFFSVAYLLVVSNNRRLKAYDSQMNKLVQFQREQVVLNNSMVLGINKALDSNSSPKFINYNGTIGEA